jgi:hypothetical protein
MSESDAVENVFFVENTSVLLPGLDYCDGNCDVADIIEAALLAGVNAHLAPRKIRTPTRQASHFPTHHGF